MLGKEFLYFQALSDQVGMTMTSKFIAAGELVAFGIRFYLSLPVVSEITHNPPLQYIS
jgi:hypothetical protein